MLSHRWFLPFIGHMGIAYTSGVIRDFAGPYFVSEDNMAFGWPTKYWMLDPYRAHGGPSAFDNSIQLASQEYQGRMVSLGSVLYSFQNWTHNCTTICISSQEYHKGCHNTDSCSVFFSTTCFVTIVTHTLPWHWTWCTMMAAPSGTWWSCASWCWFMEDMLSESFPLKL